jgi:3-oxo-5-alpha-steroid 4-dehydrogenase 3
MSTVEGVLGSIGSYLAPLSPSHLCQLSFALAAAGVLAVAATPPSARGLLTQYGARQSTGRRDGDGKGGNPETDAFTSLISWVTSVGKLPHSWFIHFYILSVASSIFWAVQYISNGSILRFIAEYQVARSSASMTINQVILAWFLMGMQGARRLYECLFVLRPSASEMWIVHWLVGIAYYLGINASVWIEGSSKNQTAYRFHMLDKELIL